MAIGVEEQVTYASMIRPCPGERVSGDAVVTKTLEHGLFVAIIDVLGHGAEAHEVALVIDTFLGRYGSSDIAGVMTRLHQQLKGTRGAAVGLCAIDYATFQLDYVGIGNTALRCFGNKETRFVSQHGVLGQNMRTPKSQTLLLQPGDTVVLYTDGVSDRFTSEDYPGVMRHPPQEVASKIVARFGKAHDDAACLAVRYSV